MSQGRGKTLRMPRRGRSARGARGTHREQKDTHHEIAHGHARLPDVSSAGLGAPACRLQPTVIRRFESSHQRGQGRRNFGVKQNVRGRGRASSEVPPVALSRGARALGEAFEDRLERGARTLARRQRRVAGARRHGPMRAEFNDVPREREDTRMQATGDRQGEPEEPQKAARRARTDPRRRAHFERRAHASKTLLTPVARSQVKRRGA